MPRITPFIWFDNQAEQAADFYLSVVPNSKIVRAARKNQSVPEETGDVMSIDLDLDGQPLTLLNGGPYFQLTEAFSLVVHCTDQAEVDYYWDRLLAGGQPSQCGRLKDRSDSPGRLYRTCCWSSWPIPTAPRPAGSRRR